MYRLSALSRLTCLCCDNPNGKAFAAVVALTSLGHLRLSNSTDFCDLTLAQLSALTRLTNLRLSG